METKGFSSTWNHYKCLTLYASFECLCYGSSAFLNMIELRRHDLTSVYRRQILTCVDVRFWRFDSRAQTANGIFWQDYCTPAYFNRHCYTQRNERHTIWPRAAMTTLQMAARNTRSCWQPLKCCDCHCGRPPGATGVFLCGRLNLQGCLDVVA